MDPKRAPASSADEGRHAAELLELGDAFFELDHDWRIIRVNANQEKLSQKPRQETLGRVFWEVWPETADPEGRYWREYHRCMERRVPVQFEARFEPLDLWTGVTAYPVSSGGIAVFFRDVTREKRAEQAVRAEHAFTAAVLETVANVVVVLDRQGRIVRANEACERLTGYTADELIGRVVFDVFIRDDELPGVRDTFRELRAGRFPNQHENRWRMKDGSERTIEWKNGAILGDDGEVEFVIATGVDVTDRRRDEQRLREAERRYRSLAENAPEVIARFDRQLRHTFVNEYGAKVYGVPARDVIGKTSAELGMPAEKVAFWKRHFEDVFATGEQRTVEFEFESPTFGTRFFSSLFVPERDDSGEIASVLAITRDVTEQKRAENRMRDTQESLRAREEDARAHAAQLEAILDAVADGVVVYDRDGRTLRSTRAADELLGVSAAERAAPVQDRVERQYEIRDERGGRVPREAMIAYRAAVKAETVRGEILGVRPIGGTQRWLRMNAVPFFLGGRHAGAVLSMTDISDRKRAEEALRASEEKFRSIFEQAAIGMGRVRFDDARWIDVNDAFCRMLGRSREEMLRTPWPRITHPEDVDLDLVPFRDMAAGQLESYTVEKRFLHADGRHVWARLTLSLVRDAGGAPDYEIAIIEDVTHRKRAEEEVRRNREALRDANERLRDADRRKDEFLGMLSHELRNPLAPIRNALYILDRTAPTGEQARRAKEVANRQLAHLTRLVDDLLDVTRIARGKIELRRADVDLAALAHRAAEDHRAIMHDRRLELDAQLPAGPVTVNADETRLAQVLGNLLHNAAKFTPAGGRVTLAVAAEGDRAAIRVRDTGSGIAPDVLPTIFEPFTQAKQTLARSEGGLGLGLALVKGLVAMHGGEVRAYSPGQGRGTEFVVTLPLAAPHDAVTRDRAPVRRAGGRRRRVLVVDDNRDAADTIAELVQMLGHDVEVAYDPHEAIAKASAAPPDVVFCDIGLPGMDGYELARQLRARAADHRVRLIALSGYAQSEDVARALEAGFDAHVAKPPDPDQLVALVG